MRARVIELATLAVLALGVWLCARAVDLCAERALVEGAVVGLLGVGALHAAAGGVRIALALRHGRAEGA